VTVLWGLDRQGQSSPPTRRLGRRWADRRPVQSPEF